MLNDTKTEFVGLKVTPEFKKLLQQEAAKEGRSVSNYIVIQLKKAGKEK